jgi:hypothetical protein
MSPNGGSGVGRGELLSGSFFGVEGTLCAGRGIGREAGRGCRARGRRLRPLALHNTGETIGIRVSYALRLVISASSFFLARCIAMAASVSDSV